jgi:hypothetical protein
MFLVVRIALSAAAHLNPPPKSKSEAPPEAEASQENHLPGDEL